MTKVKYCGYRVHHLTSSGEGAWKFLKERKKKLHPPLLHLGFKNKNKQTNKKPFMNLRSREKEKKNLPLGCHEAETKRIQPNTSPTNENKKIIPVEDF